uniref:Putative tail protein n=1 Tax=viral metagenome TaxID=1070528 RepID=A0A6H1ZCF0_9ZZZZ
MKIPKFNSDILFAGFGLLALIGGFLISRALISSPVIGATPASGNLPGIYNATTTDLTLRDGYGSALATDVAGRLILSPSSSGEFDTLTVGTFTATTATITGVSAGDILPSANNTYDIGSGALSWKDVYASGTARFGSIVTNSGTVGASITNIGGVVTTISDSTAGAYGLKTTGAVRIDGVTLTADVQPITNNTKNLGSVTSGWKDVYASGTFHGADVDLSGTLDVGGNTSLGGTLGVDGNVIMDGSSNRANDNKVIGYGSGLDYWGTYVSADTEFNFSSTNVDGSGTDGTLWSIVDGTDTVAFPGTIQTGQFTFEDQDEASFLTWADMGCVGTTAGEQCSYIAKLGGEYMMKMYGEHDGSGNVQNQSINMYPDTLKFGKRDVTSYMYIGTTDGCGALTFTTSSTYPTLTPTSTSFCN